MKYLFNFGSGEILVILLIVLLLFGSKRLPEFSRMLGKAIKEIRNATNDIKSNLYEQESNKVEQDIKNSINEYKNKQQSVNQENKTNT